MKYFNGVDRNDPDSKNYSTSIRTNRYYLRIICWALDRVIHVLYNVVIFLVDMEIGERGWKKYTSKETGRHDFQIDLGVALMKRAIEMDWDGTSRKTKPKWMRREVPVPCNCETCYFCINCITTGIDHKVVKRKGSVSVFFYVREKKRVKWNACTDVVESVPLGLKSGRYCGMCYRDSKQQGKSGAIKKKDCKTSTKGCPYCKEPICKGKGIRSQSS